MKRFGVLAVGLLLSVAPSAQASPSKASPRACCRAAAGTVVQVELADPVGTKTQRSGDTFALRLARPVVVNGRMVLRAGTPGVGEVIQASKPGMGGKGAKLVLAAKYLTVNGRRVPLRALQLSGAGRGKAMTAQALGLTGIAFGPLGFIGFAVKGGDVLFPAGTPAYAKLGATVTLPSLGPAPRDRARPMAVNPPDGVIDIAPPPAGMGQIVFFRRKSILGTAQWFNVREEGRALGKLANGAYFIQIAQPGLHTYTATEEPEFKDSLKLKIDAGETYFVEGGLTKGVVLGAADLAPSDRAAFNDASKSLKLADAPGEAASAQPSVGRDVKVDQPKAQ